MKKSIFVLLVCLVTSFAYHSVVAADVGKHPPKVTKQNIVCDMQSDLVAVYTVEPLSAPGTAVIYVSNSIDAPQVSMPKGDAAIPRSAQASYLHTKYYKLPLSITIHNFCVDRYWC